MSTVPPHLHRSLAYRITHVQRVLRLGFFRVMRDAGLAELTPEQWWMLAQIVHLPGCVQSDLADDLFGDRPNVTRMLDRMQAAGLVERRDDPADARCRRVHATAAGVALHDRALQAAEAERARLAATLDPHDVAATLRVLDALERLYP